MMPVLEKLRSSPGRIRKIQISAGRNDQRTSEIRSLAKDSGVPVLESNRRDLDQLFDREVNHQGIVAIVKNADLISIEELIEGALGNETSTIALLDGIQDPGNLGAIIRSAECAGLDGLILPERNSVGITDTVVKSSAGAVDNIALSQVGNVATAMNLLKEAGYWIIGADAAGENNYSDWDYDPKTVIVLGSEGKGIRRLTSEKCDVLVSIPMQGQTSSLNVSVTAGILFFEVNRQRLIRG